MEASKEQSKDWQAAVNLLDRWHAGEAHLDDLLEQVDLGRSRWLVMDVFRNAVWIDAVIDRFVKRRPRPRTQHLLRLAVAECLNRDPVSHPKIVHHAVEVGRAMKLSRSETGFVNGLLRTLLRESALSEGPDPLATHPDWIVARWNKTFGKDGTRELLRWNQGIPELSLRAAACPEYAQPTKWPGFFHLEPAQFDLALPDLVAGEVYMQDPFTRVPVELLSVCPGEIVLDLCAAPGGKTRMLAEAMQGKGSLIAVDRPGHRTERLRDNLHRAGHEWVKVLATKIEDLNAEALFGEADGSLADAVMLDVPCSNTGVIQKRPDVKLRLRESDIERYANQQLGLLERASEWVRPGGRLVYSSCSLENEENTGVVQRFLGSHADWRLEQDVISYPWECRHDGGGAFLLTRGNAGKK